ncbi:hypothetical protein Q1695_016357 [Nippostrongylus brasiliensis]|nr:hypothetical protein Q1695_016357 [Nippostrongylus brasiliensis]
MVNLEDTCVNTTRDGCTVLGVRILFIRNNSSGLAVMDSLEASVENEKRRLTMLAYSNAVAIGDYFTAGELCDKFIEQEGFGLYEACRKLGYLSVDDFLSTSEKFSSAIIQCKKKYKALESGSSEATKAISNLIKKQNKKKKKPVKINTVDRQYPTRDAQQYRSFRVNPSHANQHASGDQNPSTFQRNGYYGSLRETRTIHGPPKNFTLPRRTNGNKSNPAVHSQKGEPVQSGSLLKKLSPAIGVERFLQALQACNGSATSDQLNAAYQRLYKVDWDMEERYRCFGCCAVQEVIENFLKDVVGMEAIRGLARRRFFLLNKKPAPNPKREEIARAKPKIAPSLAELYECLVNILLDVYPESVHVDSLTKTLFIKYNMIINPMESHQMSWKKLISNFYCKQLNVDAAGNLSLNAKDPLISDRMLKKSQFESLEAPISSDSEESVGSSLAAALSSASIGSSVNRDVKISKPSPELTVFVDQSSTRRVVHNASYNAPTTFDRDSKVRRSLRGVSTVTTHFDDGFSDLAGVPSASQPSGCRITFSNDNCASSKSSSSASFYSVASSSENWKSASQPAAEAAKVNPAGAEQKKTSSRWLPHTAVASMGNFFRRKDHIADKAEVPPTLNEIHQSGVGSVQRSGIASGAPLKHDVECAHPYFNVHAISKGGDARMMATRTGLAIKEESESVLI